MGHFERAETHPRDFAEIPPPHSAGCDTPGRERLIALDQAPAWVSVQESTPSASGEYLVYLRSAQYRLMQFDSQVARFMPRSMNALVTHWMALPAKPGD